MASNAIELLPLKAGRYVVAVSGGVDSMALLDMLRRRTELDLVVAHLNHGIRPDAEEDAKLVAAFCMSHNIPCVVQRVSLGSDAGEDVARRVRYSFLRKCRTRYKADAIVTAHHQDDVIETAVINLLRGTGWLGLAPFVGRGEIVRPLLNVAKPSLVAYARRNHVPWHEDNTNTSRAYLRNYVRHDLLPRLQKQRPLWREDFLRLICNQQLLRRKIEDELGYRLTCDVSFETGRSTSARYLWIMLPPEVAYELLQALFRRQLGTSLVRPLTENVLLFAKTAKPGKRMALGKGWARVTATKFIVEL